MESLTTASTWQEAFERQSISNVKILEKQLRTSVNRDKEKLRALVGGNYRDLLATAEEIVALNEKTRTAERHISDLGALCKPPNDDVTVRSEQSSKFSYVAQLKLLTQVLACAANVLHHGSELVAAKLVVISRLLLRSLTDNNFSSLSVNRLRDKDRLLRRTILRKINSRLVQTRSNLKSTIQAICAYCLITSASSGEALKHFRSCRHATLQQHLQSEGGKEPLLGGYKYLVASVLAITSLSERGVNDALNSLQRQPILEDASIVVIEMLGLGLVRSLIPKDILTFTPYIKRVTLTQEENKELLRGWISEAEKSLAESLKVRLDKVHKFHQVLHLRKAILEILLPHIFELDMAEDLLKATTSQINLRVENLCQSRTADLHHVARRLAGSHPDSKQFISLWNAESSKQLSGQKSDTYMQKLLKARLGVDEEIDKQLRRLLVWCQRLLNMREQISALQSIRWQDIIEDPDEDEEEQAVAISMQLSRNEPLEYERCLEAALKTALNDFEGTIESSAKDVYKSVSSSIGTKTDITLVTFMLRTIRESSILLRKLKPDLRFERMSQVVPELYDLLIGIVKMRLEDVMENQPEWMNGSIYTLEDMPSPVAIKALQTVCQIMTEMGGFDIWSHQAVRQLKKALATKVFDRKHQKYYAYHHFDELYLRAALEHSSPAQSDQDKATNVTNQKAAAYWSRTRLLFGNLNT